MGQLKRFEWISEGRDGVQMGGGGKVHRADDAEARTLELGN